MVGRPPKHGTIAVVTSSLHQQQAWPLLANVKTRHQFVTKTGLFEPDFWGSGKRKSKEAKGF